MQFILNRPALSFACLTMATSLREARILTFLPITTSALTIL